MITPSQPLGSQLDEQRLALKSVLGSSEFRRTPALARLLEYLCEKTFEGRVHEIKEFTIAADVYSRSETFGENRDSIVRVEVSRLRKRLRSYYASEGADQDLRIVIPAGTYQPTFERVTPETPLPPTAVATEPPARSHTRYYWAFAGVAIALAASVVLLRPARRDALPPTSPPIPAAVAQPASGNLARPIRILAGSSAERLVDRFGVEWGPDRYFTGGEQNHWQFGGKEMGVPARTIRWAPDQLYFRSFRFGTFSYKIPLPAGKYDLKLYFSEVIFMPTESDDGVENRRIFDVLLNGKPLLTSYDIAADAGGSNSAAIRAFTGITPLDGYLTLDFRPVLVGAWLNAIEIVPNNTGHPLPIRVFAHNGNYTDHAGNLWEFDRFYHGGRQISDGEVVGHTQDPELFLSQRYGNFTYRFPVPAGSYTLRMLFAETFFGPHNRGKGGAGSRIFNVISGGTTLLRNFEIFKEAGEKAAIEKVFRGLVPNAQGRIDVSFEPVVQYPVVNALELVAER